MLFSTTLQNSDCFYNGFFLWENIFESIQTKHINNQKSGRQIKFHAVTPLHRYRGKDNPFLVVIPEFSLDMLQLKAELDLCLRILGMANSQLALRRRLTMRRYLTPGFKRLCDEHSPLSQWMFGGNVKATIF